MSKEASVLFLGVLVLLSPYLGIPGTWRTALLVVVGVLLVIVGFLLRGQAVARHQKHAAHQPFVENDLPAATHPAHEHKEGISSFN